MNVLRIHEPGKIMLRDEPAPYVTATPRVGEVLLKMAYVGFCGSDLNTFLGRNAMAKADVIPGHEIGATIAAVGADVPDTLKVGQTVTVNPYTNCVVVVRPEPQRFRLYSG